ncbi:MAG: GTPase ObgE, partial [Kiritimatiellae bacterium]|nr:GTPase ObgE [Kiritimatiellia bacterium]
MKSRSFVDTAVLHATAGKGGDGSRSFRHEKFVPKGGPDGGDGGRGGSVWLVGDEDVDSLVGVFYEPERRAPDGGAGMGRYRHGANGADLSVKVPLGTVVSDAETGRELGEILAHGQRLLVARGGDGGAGNVHFKSSTHQAPEEFKPGKPGEEVRLRLDLKILADVGLVGFPSAGKSSILREISRARPKVAAYHFTTLHPILGTVVLPDSFTSFRVADIPGIVEGAHEGAGLGFEFMRHIERAKAIVLVVDMAAEEGRDPAEDYRTLLRELEARDPALLERPRLVVASKMDAPAAKENLKAFKKETGVAPLETSVAEHRGFEKLVARLVKIVKPVPHAAGRRAA